MGSTREIDGELAAIKAQTDFHEMMATTATAQYERNQSAIDAAVLSKQGVTLTAKNAYVASVKNLEETTTAYKIFLQESGPKIRSLLKRKNYSVLYLIACVCLGVLGLGFVATGLVRWSREETNAATSPKHP